MFIFLINLHSQHAHKIKIDFFYNFSIETRTVVSNNSNIYIQSFFLVEKTEICIVGVIGA